MKRTPFLSNILRLLGVATAFTLTQQEVEAGTMHTDVPMVTYMDFGQNQGRYAVGSNVNALLGHIRTNVDQGIVIHYTDGTPSFTISNSQGMIDYSAVHDGGYAAAMGPNMIATVAHNGEINGSFAERVVGSNHAINYSAVGVRYSHQEARDKVVFRLVPPHGDNGIFDYCLQRQTKIFTDITPSPMSTLTDVTSKRGDYQFHAGAGSMNMWSETDGKYHFNQGSLIGSIKTINITSDRGSDCWIIISDPNYGNGVGASTANPLPIGTEGGDSGSPVFIYNSSTGQYEYFVAHEGGTGISSAQGWGNIKWSHEALKQFDVCPDMSSGEVHLQAITSAGEYHADQAGNSTTTYYGYVTDAAGNILEQYTGVRSGLNTWADLSGIRNQQNWYAWNSDAYILQSDVDLFFTENLVFNATQATNKIVLDATVDLGIGYAEFNAGEPEKAVFTITSQEGEGNLFNHSGYVINEGAEVHLQLTNPADYMAEWRKTGAGDLYIDGTGNTNAFLALGGSGTTYLQQKDGWAAYNVIVGSGATVVIQDIHQIARDFTFGNDGGVLDMNGQSMDWYSNNPDVAAAGFSINALTEGAIITNSTGTTTLTYKESGVQTWLGSFADTKDGALQIIYDGGGTWNLHSIHTDLSHHAGSGLSVASGKVILAGTHTVHGLGSETGHTSNRLLLENDWHYADAKMNVAVAKGATFELGSHARLTGNITVAEGGTFIMREGVRDRYEHVEGGVYLEDTYQYAAFYGLKGDISLAGEMQVVYSEGTTANTTYSGSISGGGKLTVAAGTSGGTLTLAGDNSSFTGTREIISGGVIATSNAALGSATQNKAWLIGKLGWLASHEFTDAVNVLSYVDSQSTGTLALSNDLANKLNLSNHTGLFLGAEAGKTVQYGAEGTTEVWTAVGENYLLGGGGGTLVVNFQLTGDTTGVVLGADASSTGKVVLANAGNDFGGSITFAGTGITLEVVEGAMSDASLNLSYGNALLSAASGLAHLSADSEGIILVDKATAADINLSLPMAMGASADTTYSGALTPAAGDTYRFSTVNGATLTLATALSDDHDTVVDAQGHSGGTVVLAGNASYAGDITVQGHRDSSAAGDITLAAGRDITLSGDITLAKGGTLDVVGHNMTLSGNVIGAGGSIINSSWDNLLDTEWSGTLTLHAEAGESRNITAGITAPAIYKTGAGNVTLSAANTYTDIYLQEGTLTPGQADALSIYGTVHMSGGTTLDLGTHQLSKNTYMNKESIIVESGSATVQQSGTTAEHVALIQGDILLRSGTELHLKGEGAYELSGTTFGGENAVLHVDAPQLRLQSGNEINIAGTLSFSADGSLHSQATSNGMVRNINALQMLNGATLTLSEQGGTNYWQVNSLSGNGTLQWNSTTNHVDGDKSTASRLVISGASEFEGSIRFDRSKGHEDHIHGAYLELAHDQAAQFADISLHGSSAISWATLAVNTDNAILKGLSGNEYSYVFAGAAGNTLFKDEAHPVSTRTSTLSLHVEADKTYSYAGVVGHSADTLASGLSLVKSGAGTQKFTGTSYLGHVSVQGGTLSFGGPTSIAGDVDLAYGAHLSGVDYTLGSGQMFTVSGSGHESAVFGGILTLAGGELSFEGTGLQSGTVALSLGGVAQLEGNTHVISLTNAGGLSAGTTYTLATGDWSSLLSSLTVNSSRAWDAVLSTNASGHLLLTLNNKSGSLVWDGTSEAHIWSTSQFGSTSCSLGSEAVAVFDDTAAHATVQVTENISVAEAHFRNASHAYNVTSADGAVATVGSMTVNGNVTLESGIQVTGQTAIDSGELVLKSTGMLQGSVSGRGTLGIDWGADASESLSINQLNTLHIISGSYGAANHSALDVNQIVVESGARYVQGDNVTQDADIVSRGGAVELAGGGLSGQFTMEADTELAVRSGDVAFNTKFADQGHTLTQTGRGTVHLGTGFSGSLSHYKVQGGTLQFDAPLADGEAHLITVGTGAGLVLAGSGEVYNHHAHYLDTVVVESGGTLRVNQYATANINTVELRGGNYVFANGDWYNYSTSNVNFRVVNAGKVMVHSGANSSVVRGTISGSGTLTFSGQPSDRYTLESTIFDGDAPLALSFSGTGVIVTGTNTYTGGTTITGGYVQVNNVQALGLGLVTFNGGELNLADDLYVNGLAGAGGTVNINNKVIALATQDTALFGGAVRGDGAIYHTGSGTGTLKGTVNVGDVVAASGTLELKGNTTINRSAQVLQGATLVLDGSVSLQQAIENAGTVSISETVSFAVNADDFIDGVYTLVQGTGAIQGADALAQSNLALSGYDLTTLQNSGVQFSFVETNGTLSVQANAFRDLVWTGSLSSDVWNTTGAHWVGMESGQSAVAGQYDRVTFDSTAQLKDIKVESGASVLNMTVRDADYSFYGSGLNVTGNFLVESGASVSLEATPEQLGNAVVKGTLKLEGSATLGSLYIDASEGTIIKNTGAYLTWNPADGKSIDVGTFINTSSNFTTSSALNIGTFELQQGTFYLQNLKSADAELKKIDCLVLGNGSTTIIENYEAPSHFTTLGEVRLAGSTATIRDNWAYNLYESYVRINQLSLAEGVESGTLNLQMYADRGVAVYEIGTADSGSNNFAGTILLDTESMSTTGHAAVILSGTQVAEKACINLVDNAENGVTTLGLGVHAERTHIAGLESDRAMGNRAKVFSGTIGSGQSSISDSSITDVAERTLVINAAAGSTHTFYGEVLSTVNIEKRGSGTQVLAGTVGSSKLSVLGGTLSLAGATIGSGALSQVELGRGAELQHNLTVDAAHALKLTGLEGAAGTATLSGNLVLGGGNLVFDSAWLSETEASLTVNGSISLAGGMSTQAITLSSNEGIIQGSSYLLMSGAFAEGITADSFTLTMANDTYSGSLSLSESGLWLHVAASGLAHVWAGTEEANVWSATTYGTVVSGVLGENKPATFDDTADGYTVLVQGAVSSPGGMVFNNTADYNLIYTNINSIISTPSLALTNTGKVTIGVALDADSISLAKGTLVLRDRALLTGDTTVSMTDGATLDITSTSQVISGLSMAEGTTITDFHGTGHLTVKNPAALGGVINVGTINTQGDNVVLTVGADTHSLSVQSGKTTLVRPEKSALAHFSLGADTTLASATALAMNAGMQLSVLGSGATLEADVTWGNGSTLFFDNVVLSDTEAALHFSGSLSLAEGAKVNVSVSDVDALLNGGTWKLATGDWSAFTGSEFVFDYKAPELATFSISDNTLVMTLLAHRIWAGSNAEHSWSNSVFGTADALPSATAALFDDTAENTRVQLAESVSVGSMRFDHTKDYTLSTDTGATITNTGNLYKTGTGALDIQTALSVGGNVDFSGGTVTFADTVHVAGDTRQTNTTVSIQGDNSTFGDYLLVDNNTLHIEGAGITMGTLQTHRIQPGASAINLTGGSATFAAIELSGVTTIHFQKPAGAESTVYEATERLGFTTPWGTGSTTVLVDEGVKLKLGSIYSSWGWGTFDINGEVEVAGHITLSSGTEEPITGSGCLTAGSLSTHNTGTYIFDVAQTTISGEVNIAGGKATILRSGTFTSESVFKQTGSKLTLEGGTLELNGTSTLSGGELNLIDGKIDVQSGTATISNTVTATGGEVAVSGGKLKLGNTDAAYNLLSGVEAITLSSGMLDLSKVSFAADGAGIALQAAVQAADGFTLCLGGLEAGNTYTIFDLSAQGASFDNWQNLDLMLDGAAASRFSGVSLTLTDTAATIVLDANYNLTTYDKLYWAGGASGVWDQTTANWDGNALTDTAADNITYAEVDTAYFAANTTTSITSALTSAHAVKIGLEEGAKVTLEGGESFTFGSMSLAKNANLILNGNKYIFTEAIGSANQLGTIDYYAPNLEVSNSNGLDLYGKFNVHGDVLVSGNRIAVASGAELHLTDQSSLTRKSTVAYWMRGALVVDADAEASFISTDDVHLSYQVNGGKIQLEEGSSLTMSVRNLTTYNDAQINVGANASLDLRETKAVNLQADATVQLADGAELLGTLTASGNGVAVKSAGTASLGTLAITGGTTTVSMASDATAASLSLDSLAMTGGTFKLAGGTLSLASAVGTTGGALTIAGGALELNATSAEALLEGVASFSMSSGSLDLADVDFASNSIALKSGASFSFSGGVIELGNLAADTTYNIFDASAGTLSGWDSLGIANFTLGGTALADLGRVSLSLENGTFAYQLVRDLTWTGSASSVWNTSDTNWTDTPADATDADIAYAAGEFVTFASGTHEISVEGTIRAGSLLVKKEANITLSLADGASLSVDSPMEVFGKLTLDGFSTIGNDMVNLGDGASLTLKGGAYGVVGDLGAKGATINFSGTQINLASAATTTFYGDVNILSDTVLDAPRGNGNWATAGPNIAGTMTVGEDITLTITGDSRLKINDDATLLLKDGATVERTGTNAGAYYIKGSLATAENAQAAFESTNDVHLNYINTSADSSLSDTGGSIDVARGSTLVVDVNNLTSYGSAAINVAAGGTLDVTGTENVNLQGSVTVTLADEAKVLGTLKANGNNTVTIATTGEASVGTLNLSAGTLNANGTGTLGMGTFAVSGGNATLTSGADISTLTQTGGTVNFNGTTDIATATISNGTVNVNGTTDITTATISGGTTTFKGDLTVGTLTQTGGTVTLWNTAAASGAQKLIDKVVLGNAVTLIQHSHAVPTAYTHLGALELSGAKATIQEEYYGGAVSIGTLNKSYAGDTELVLDFKHDATNISLVKLGAAGVDAGNFSGVVSMIGSNSGRNRSAALIIGNDTIAQNAVIKMESPASPTAQFMLGVHTANATIGGLNSVVGTNSDGTSRGQQYALFSGAIAPNTSADWINNFSTNWLTDTADRTITFDVAQDGDYTFTGIVHGADNARLSFVKIGSGSQTFSGVAHVGDVSVNNGTLALSNASSVIHGNITVSGGVLDFDGTYTLGSGQSLHVATRDAGAVDLATLVLSGGALVFDAGVLSGTEAALNVGSLSLTSGAAYIIDLRGVSALTEDGTLMLASGDWSNAQGVSFTIKGFASGQASIAAGADGLYLDYVAAAPQYTWAGGASGIWDTSAGNWDATPDDATDGGDVFEHYVDVVFNDSATTKEVTLASDITVGEMTIESGAYKFGGAYELTVDSLTIAGSSVTTEIGNDGTNKSATVLTVNESSVVEGTLDLSWAGATLNLKGDSHEIDKIVLRGNPTDDTKSALNLHAQSAQIGSIEMLNVSSATFGLAEDETTANYEVGTITIKNNTDYTDRKISVGSGVNLSVTDTLSIAAGHTWDVDGALTINKLTQTDGEATLGGDGTITISGAATISGGKLTVAADTAFSSGVTLNGGTLVLNHQRAAHDSTIALNDTTKLSTLQADTAANIAGLSIAANAKAKVTGSNVTTGSMTLGSGSTLTVDTTTVKVTDGVTQSEGSRVLGASSGTNRTTTTIIPTNGGVLDDRGSLYAVGGTLTIGDDDATTTGGTVYVKGLALMGNGEDNTSTLNVKAGNTFVITGTTNTGTAEATLAGKNYGDFQITTYDDASQYSRNQKSVINVDGTLTANSRFSVAGGTATFNVKSGGTVNMLDGTGAGGANTTIVFDVAQGGRVNIASYEDNRTGDNDNITTVKLAGGATLGGIAPAANDAHRGEDIYMLQKVEIGGTATIDTDAATYDTTTFVVTETDSGTDMVFTREMSSKAGADAVLKVTGHGTAHVGNTATLSGGVEVEQGASLAVSAVGALGTGANQKNNTVTQLAGITAAEGAVKATIDGAVSISHTGTAATIAGTGTEAARMDNSLVTIAQGASLTVKNMMLSGTSSLRGKAQMTYAARSAAVAQASLVNSTLVLSKDNGSIVGDTRAKTLTQLLPMTQDTTGALTLSGNSNVLAVTSSALSDLVLTSGTNFVVDFSSLLAAESLANVDFVELSFADANVSFADISSTYISGVLNTTNLTAYYDSTVANVGAHSIYFDVRAIPEPTTTTLSLLALAGLVARRRRR